MMLSIYENVRMMGQTETEEHADGVEHVATNN